MKKISKILVALLLGIVALFGVVGCGPKDAQKSEDNEDNSVPVENLELSAWQEFTDENTFIVSVNRAQLGHSLKAEDFESVNVEEIISIDGVSAKTDKWYPERIYIEYDFYSVKTMNSSDEDLHAIREFEFVDFAWRNEYDYRIKVTPVEAKRYVEIQDYWQGFHGNLAVTIDKSFKKRIFTAEDFNLPNIVSVEWYTYDEFKSGSGTLGHIFHVKISDNTDVAAKAAQETLYHLDFVREVSPDYAINDFPGYPGERP